MTQTTFSPNGHKRAVLYSRVSGDDSKKDGRNLKSQLDMGREYSRTPERNYRIVAELHEDDKGASGASFDLPQLGKILAMAERKEFDVLVVRELDRLSRNLAKQLTIEAFLKRHGVRVEYVMGEYPDTPEGNLLKHVKASIAEYQREDIKIKTVRGRRNVVKGGRIMLHGDNPPYGYRTVMETRNGKSVVAGLKVYEPEARIVRLIFDWYVTGDESGDLLSMRAIVKRLSKMNVPTWCDVHKGLSKHRARGQWAFATVFDILHSAVYIGKWQYGKGSNKKRQAEPWIEVQVDPIIHEATWHTAQSRCKENTNFSKRNVKHEYLMLYRLSCQCGYSVGSYAVDTRQLYLYYRCSSRSADLAKGNCHTPSFRADYVDALVWDWLKEWFKDPADLRRKLEAYQAEQDKINAPILALLKTNEDLIAENQEHTATVKRMCEAKIYTIEESIDRMTRLNDTHTSLDKARDELRARLVHHLSANDIENVVQMALDIRDGLAEADESFEKRRRMIEVLDVRCILKIEDGEQVCYASFILTGKNSKRLVLPKRGERLSNVIASSHTSEHNQQNGIVISARLVLPNTRKHKPQADIGALFAKVPQPVTAEVTR